MADTTASASTCVSPSAATIRRATTADLEALFDMVNAAYAQSEGHVFTGSKRTDRDQLALRLDGLHVAEHVGRLAGCIHIDRSGDAAHFGLLAVDVALHGSGLGVLLIDHAERLARDAGHGRMRIETVKEAGLVGYYERIGYRVAGETDGQVWNNGVDWGAVVPWHMVDMEKRLR